MDEDDYWWVLLCNLLAGGILLAGYRVRSRRQAEVVEEELSSDSDWLTDDTQDEFTEKDRGIYMKAYYKKRLGKGLPYRQLRGYLGRSTKGLVAKSRKLIADRLERELLGLDTPGQELDSQTFNDFLADERSRLTERNLASRFGRRGEQELEEGSLIRLDSNSEFAFDMNSELDSEILSRRDLEGQLDSESVSYSDGERSAGSTKRSHLLKRNNNTLPLNSPSFSPLGRATLQRVARGITPAYEKEVLRFIKKVTTTNQADDAEEFKLVKSAGKASWRHTHFIFMIDCSGSMKGARWDAVKFGYMVCLDRIKAMTDVVVSAFTFDTVPNPFCKERTPKVAIAYSRDLPFTGRGTNYKRALRYAISLMKKSRHKDYLFCLMFLSDGLGGFSEEPVNELREMKRRGKKVLFYTVAFKTSRDQEMLKMASMLQGEHYKITNTRAANIIFSTILTV